VIWVIDASVALKWFIEEETHSHANEVLVKLTEQPESFAVPELFAFEVFAVLERKHPSALEVYRRGVIPLLQGGMLRQPMTEKLAGKAYDFVELGLTGYDACYAALALDLRGLWLTFDEKAHALIQKENISWFLDEELPLGWPE
jgi:predicted nucleic acid-binding protein